MALGLLLRVATVLPVLPQPPLTCIAPHPPVGLRTQLPKPLLAHSHSLV